MKTRSTLVLILFFSLTAWGQTDDGAWEAAVGELMTAEDAESEAWEETVQMLSELAVQPLNLNTATREELEQLTFLTPQQVEQLVAHRELYGPMKSLGELRMLPAFDPARLALMQRFAYVGAPQSERPLNWNDLLRYGRHELMGYGKVPLYRRKGDRNGYMGYPYKHWLRYTFTYNNKVKAGLVGSQDCGEPFFAGKNWGGYDFYSWFLQVRQLGRLEQLVIGKYKLSTGMGLVLNNNYGLGKLATLSQLGRSTTALRPHSSRTPAGYFQGAAATVRIGHGLTATAFASYRALDATLNKTDSSATTLLTDGYHRTPTEMAKKGNTHSADAGVNLLWRHGRFHLGATAVYTHLSRRLQPDLSVLYRRHYPQGQDFMNIGANYGYSSRRFSLNGETATNRHGALATLNSLSLLVADGLSLMAMQRFYSYRYTALYARSLSENSRVQNESAVYVGLSWQPSPRFRLQAYTDLSYAPWAKYQVSKASYASDQLVTASYQLKQWKLQARYRLHLRQRDNSDKTALYWRNEQRARLSISREGLGPVSLTTQADLSMTGQERGWSIGQQVACRWQWLRLNAACTYFDTPSYDSRVYTYEQGPLYAFSFPVLYGQGLRYMVMARTQVADNLTVTAKLGVTNYLDRSTTGTGLQQVDGAALPEVDMQIRWRF